VFSGDLTASYDWKNQSVRHWKRTWGEWASWGGWSLRTHERLKTEEAGPNHRRMKKNKLTSLKNRSTRNKPSDTDGEGVKGEDECSGVMAEKNSRLKKTEI